jgi:hypothetical protein
VPCPDNANCAGLDQAPAPEEGYWSDRKSYAYTEKIYRCSRDTCTGAEFPNSSCWSAIFFRDVRDAEGEDGSEEISSTSYNMCSPDLLCEEGSAGPLCGTCSNKFIYRGETKRCHACKEVQTNAFIICAMAAGSGLIVVAIVMEWIHLPFCGKHSIFGKFLKSIDTGSLKVVWVTYQIVISTGWSLDIRYPFPFSQLLGLLSFFTLDFLAMECFQDTQDTAQRYFTTVYLWSAIPILLAVVLVLVGVARVALVNMMPDLIIHFSSKRKARAGVVNQHMWLLLLLSYITLPPVRSYLYTTPETIIS